jgi:hypothetical protein
MFSSWALMPTQETTMTLDEALALHAKERKVGTFRLTPEELALKAEANALRVEHLLATDPVYRAGYNRMYARLCAGTGRADLLKNLR